MRQDPFEEELREQKRRRKGRGPGPARGRGWVWGGYWTGGLDRPGDEVVPGEDGDHLGGQFGSFVEGGSEGGDGGGEA